MKPRLAGAMTPRDSVCATLVAMLVLAGPSACASEKPSVWRRTDGRWSYEGSPFDAAMPESLRAIDARFAVDAAQGYYRGTPIPGSDPGSFEVIGEHHARDRRAVYWCDTYRKGQDYFLVRYVRVETIPDADPVTYRELKYEYGADAHRAYKAGQRLRAIRDPASFVILTPRLAHDDRSAYFEDIAIPDSDGASFGIVDVHDDAWVRDRTHAWHVRSGQAARGEPVTREVSLLTGASPVALRSLGNEYATDGVRLWWRGSAVKDADLSTFDTIGNDDAIDARDARGSFVRGVRTGTTP